MRILHTMLRVGDLPRSIDFYTRVLGMQLMRTTDRPEQKYRLAFVGYGDEAQRRRARAHVQLRRVGLRHRHRIRTRRDRGRRRAGRLRRRARRRRARVTREAGPVKGGTTVIAFVQDPDGYKIELIERRQGRLNRAAIRSGRSAVRTRHDFARLAAARADRARTRRRPGRGRRTAAAGPADRT